MGRWEPNALGRLQLAALELFVERGFDQTTVAEIATRAGLTERTFFRYFTDKREVLFCGQSELQELLLNAVADAPDGAAPIDVVIGAFEAAAAIFKERHEYARKRSTVIAANPDLQERELLKLTTISSAMTDTLVRRGVEAPAATLAAAAGMAVFRVAFARWVGEAVQPDFPALIRETFGELRAVTAGG